MLKYVPPSLKNSPRFHKFHKIMKLPKSIYCITLYKFRVESFSKFILYQEIFNLKVAHSSRFAHFNIALKCVLRFSNPTFKCNISFIPTPNQVFQYLKFMRKTCSTILFKQIFKFQAQFVQKLQNSPKCTLVISRFCVKLKKCTTPSL